MEERALERKYPPSRYGPFNILLIKTGLLDDVNGNRRLLYSMRHTRTARNYEAIASKAHWLLLDRAV